VNVIEFKAFDNGFEYIQVTNASASAKIALQGGHVFHYARQGEMPLLWVSEASDFEYGKAIRGGVPICWPAFGMNNPSLLQHGFARYSMFKLLSCNEIDETKTEIILSLQDSEESLKLWPHRFRLVLKITLSEVLEIGLETINTNTNEFTITQALHTYFQVSDISAAKVRGLDNKPCLDALTNQRFTYSGDVVFAEEVDLVFQEVDGDIGLIDGGRDVKITSSGSSSVVVWNPWIDKCARMSGMAKQSYKTFVCIETANAFDDFKVIKPGESHTIRAVIQ